MWQSFHGTGLTFSSCFFCTNCKATSGSNSFNTSVASATVWQWVMCRCLMVRVHLATVRRWWQLAAMKTFASGAWTTTVSCYASACLTWPAMLLPSPSTARASSVVSDTAFIPHQCDHCSGQLMSPRPLNGTPPASTDCHPSVSFHHIQSFNCWSRRSTPSNLSVP